MFIPASVTAVVFLAILIVPAILRLIPATRPAMQSPTNRSEPALSNTSSTAWLRPAGPKLRDERGSFTIEQLWGVVGFVAIVGRDQLLPRHPGRQDPLTMATTTTAHAAATSGARRRCRWSCSCRLMLSIAFTGRARPCIFYGRTAALSAANRRGSPAQPRAAPPPTASKAAAYLASRRRRPRQRPRSPARGPPPP